MLTLFPKGAAANQCRCGHCGKEGSKTSRCPLWLQLSSQRTSKSSKANATRLVSILAFCNGKKFQDICDVLYITEICLLDNYHMSQKVPYRPESLGEVEHQITHLAPNLSIKLPQSASWPRVGVSSITVLGKALEQNIPFIPLFTEGLGWKRESSVQAVGSPKKETKEMEDTEPSSSMEESSSEGQEKPVTYRMRSFVGNPTQTQIQPNLGLAVCVGVKTGGTEFPPSPSLLLPSSPLDSAHSIARYHVSNGDRVDVELIFHTNASPNLTLKWLSSTNTLSLASFPSIPPTFKLEFGRICFTDVSECTVTSIEITLSLQNGQSSVYRLPLLLDVSPESKSSPPLPITSLIQQTSHTLAIFIDEKSTKEYKTHFRPKLGSSLRVITPSHATRENVISALEKISASFLPNDSFELWYFGHLHHPSQLCTKDCHSDCFQGVPLSFFKDLMDKFPTVHFTFNISLSQGQMRRYCRQDWNSLLFDLHNSYNNFLAPLLAAVEVTLSSQKKRKRGRKPLAANKRINAHDKKMPPNKNLSFNVHV